MLKQAKESSHAFILGKPIPYLDKQPLTFRNSYDKILNLSVLDWEQKDWTLKDEQSDLSIYESYNILKKYCKEDNQQLSSFQVIKLKKILRN